jgi:hypothetical protein
MWSDNETSIDLLGFQHLVAGLTSIVSNDRLLPANYYTCNLGDAQPCDGWLLGCCLGNISQQSHDTRTKSEVQILHLCNQRFPTLPCRWPVRAEAPSLSVAALWLDSLDVQALVTKLLLKEPSHVP